MYFDPFPPSWLLIYNPHSQNHCLSDPPGSRCTCRPSLIQSDINRIEAMGSHEKREGEKERCVPGSERSWWHGSRPASILPHQGSAHPGWMKRLADAIGNILHTKQEIHFEPVFLPFISLICSVFAHLHHNLLFTEEKSRFIQKTCYIFGAVAQNYPKVKAENCKHRQAVRL